MHNFIKSLLKRLLKELLKPTNLLILLLAGFIIYQSIFIKSLTKQIDYHSNFKVIKKVRFKTIQKIVKIKEKPDLAYATSIHIPTDWLDKDLKLSIMEYHGRSVYSAQVGSTKIPLKIYKYKRLKIDLNLMVFGNGMAGAGVQIGHLQLGLLITNELHPTWFVGYTFTFRL